MTTDIDIPHTLGREEAKRRMQARTGDLARHIPGGAADVRTAWPEEYRMAVDVAALGQQLSAILEVEDRHVRVRLELPMMLSFASGAIKAAVERKGAQLLLGEDRRPDPSGG